MKPRIKVLNFYLDLLYKTQAVPDDLCYRYAEILAYRHRSGWRIPDTTYKRCKNILYYKESLERPSPYYVDICKIEEYEKQEIVIKDLVRTMKITL